MMGVGNLTELSDVDSAGLNFLLAAICQEWSIHSVLTTEVINWARSSVRELDRARRIVAYAVRNQTIPKHIDAGLVMLRDAARLRYTEEELNGMAAAIKDRNYRILLSDEQIHLIGGRRQWHGRDPFDVFDQMQAEDEATLSPAHAFYLGYEMCKAEIASQLDKNYNQDEALDWGILTVPEPERHRLRKWPPPNDA
jgi:dihydropteroate synthase